MQSRQGQTKIASIIIVLVIIGAIALAAFYLRSSDSPTSPPSSATSLHDTAAPNDTVPTVIATSLNTPWSIVFLDDGTPLVSSRNTGEIHELGPDGTSRVIGTVAGAAHRGEGGLLGMAIDEQSRLYVYFTTATDNRIARYPLTGAPGSWELGQQEIIIDGIPSASNHNGGRIAFGPDGMLYATTGDAGKTESAQSLDSLQGKILRMTPDGLVPDDNPFSNSLVYSYGHRNPQGLAWAEDGTLFATEFGQDTWDELNIIKAGSNYGWPEVEGIEHSEGYTDPVQQWAPRNASPSGMTYANSMLYIANLRGEVLRTVPVNNPGTSIDLYSGQYGRLRDVTVAPDGSLWFVTNNTDGRGDPRSDDDRILSITIDAAQ